MYLQAKYKIIKILVKSKRNKVLSKSNYNYEISPQGGGGEDE